MSKLKRYIRELNKTEDMGEIGEICYNFALHCMELRKRGYNNSVDRRSKEFYDKAIKKGWCGFE